jgi:Spy/CpxP family protein refolding chaperone
MNPESRRKARLWLAAVFVLGLATGGAFGYSFAHRSYASTKVNPPPLSEPERRARRIAEMTKEIGLSPDQANNIDSIIHAAHDEMKSIHDKSDADADAVRQKARAQIRQMLSPEQRPKYEAMLARMDEERKKQAAGAGK